MSMRIAVAVPIENFSMRYGKTGSFTLSSALSAGASSCSITDGSGVNQFARIFRVGDKIVFGQSTNTSYLGKTEEKTIKTITDAGATVTVTFAYNETMTYAYASGDAVSGIGSYVPGGNWSLSTSRTSYGIKPSGGGYDDDYAIQISDGGTVGTFGLSYTWQVNPFLNSTYYNWGCFHRVDFFQSSGTARTQVQLGDGSGTILASTLASSDVLTWTEFTSATFKTAPNLLNYALLSASFTLYVQTGSGDSANSFFDCFWCEHADGTTPQYSLTAAASSAGGVTGINVLDNTGLAVGDTILIASPSNNSQAEGVIVGLPSSQAISVNLTSSLTASFGDVVKKKNNGYYTFEEKPDFGDSWEIEGSHINVRLLNNTLRRFSPSGNSELSNRYGVKLQFSNVATTFLDKLMEIKKHQDRGSRINLHLDDTFPDIPVPFIQGFMEITNLKKSNWDRSKVSFDLVVEGAE